jgi:ribA/ribD-fused uncharacterized protein
MGTRMESNNYYETDEYIFFFGSFYSQWAMRDIEIDGVVFNCCEQLMMAAKADLFNDKYAFKQIMESDDPAEQKAWGRRVEGFDREKWEKVARDVVYKANYAKFTQHHDLGLELLSSGDKIIVEASPTDVVWGVGLLATDRKILDPKNWRGTNWLGEAIMKVREELRNEK